ncbi:MAG: DUF59 domain-containing protein [Spirochaetales bacterium]|nr:DUF59 domain-containing protein [Spirochaetales bacterium]
MADEVRASIDAALASVIEPQTLVSVLDLGFVAGVSYSETGRRVILRLAVEDRRFACPACSLVDSLAVEDMARRVREAVGAALPGWTVETT